MEEEPVLLVRTGVAPSKDNSGMLVALCDGAAPVESGDGGSLVMAGVLCVEPKIGLCLMIEYYYQGTFRLGTGMRRYWSSSSYAQSTKQISLRQSLRRQ